MSGLAVVRALAVVATPGPWQSRAGQGPDHFAPEGYKYVQFGPTEAKANGLGTDQLSPEDADLIVAAVNFVRTLDRTDTLLCGRCGDNLMPSEIEGHLNSEGRSLA